MTIIIFPGCLNSGKIDEDKFVIVYTDILIAQDTSTTSLKDLKKQILKKHGETEESYQKTIKYYNEDIARWEDFFDKVEKYALAKKKQGSI